jgi:aminoglycoside phosphotransferase (APT) family kinase protein
MITDANMVNNMNPAGFFEHHIRQHAVEYFPGLEAEKMNVRLVNGRQYRYSQFYRFEVSAGGKSFRALVKTPSLNPPKGRPKLGPIIEPSAKFEAQYKAMSKIHDYFTGLADPRFGTVRTLDIVTEQQAIIMEEVPAPSLRHLVEQTRRLKNPLRGSGGPNNLAVAFRNAGAWLGKFHSMPAVQSVKVTHNGRRSDFIVTINKLVDFLIDADHRNLFLQQVAAKTVQDAMQFLPEELPLGLRHGDYGLSNILAGADGKVTVLDTPAICHSPIYEDLAYLLIGLKAKWSQVLSLELAYDSHQFALYEREFLSGYFGQSPIPDRVIRLYEVQALLVRWSGKMFVLQEYSAGRNEFWKEFQLWQMRRFFQTMLRDLSS